MSWVRLFTVRVWKCGRSEGYIALQSFASLLVRACPLRDTSWQIPLYTCRLLTWRGPPRVNHDAEWIWISLSFSPFCVSCVEP